MCSTYSIASEKDRLILLLDVQIVLDTLLGNKKSQVQLIVSTLNAAMFLITNFLNDFFPYRFAQMKLSSLWSNAFVINVAIALYAGKFSVLGRIPGVFL